MATLKTGDKAPAFSLLDQQGKKVSLSDFKGSKILQVSYNVKPLDTVPNATEVLA